MELHQALQQVEHNPEWVAGYLEFLAGTIEPEAGQGETHHILPRAIFPEFKSLKTHPWNRIRLRSADHLLAHYYLYRALPSSKTRFAFRMMVGTRNLVLIERAYNQDLVNEVAASYAESRASMVLTEEHRNRIQEGNRRWHRDRRDAGSDYSYMPQGAAHHRRIFGISDEVKAKISLALTGRPQTPDHVEHRRLKLVGQRKPWSPAARMRLSLARKLQPLQPGFSFKGRRHTPEALAAKSQAMRDLYAQNPHHPAFTNKPKGESHWTHGTPRPADTRAKISLALTGLTATDLTRARMSVAHQQQMFDAIPGEEHVIYRQAAGVATEVELLLLRRAFKISSRPYTILTGMRIIRLGQTETSPVRAYQQASAYLQLAALDVLPLQPRSAGTRLSTGHALLPGQIPAHQLRAVGLAKGVTQAKKAFDAIPQAEHDALSRAWTTAWACSNPVVGPRPGALIAERQKWPERGRVYNILFGMQWILEGKATPETFDRWRQAGLWLRLSGMSVPVSPEAAAELDRIVPSS